MATVQKGKEGFNVASEGNPAWSRLARSPAHWLPSSVSNGVILSLQRVVTLGLPKPEGERIDIAQGITIRPSLVGQHHVPSHLDYMPRLSRVVYKDI